ncbi:MAG: response regulator [Bacteroidales bacterium]|nr:response regulator [Bacteroidales bacterium]
MRSATKILVVDDEPIGRQLLEAILIPEGYSLFFGEDGEQALKLLREYKPDIILLDVMMPKMDGFEVCKKIRGNEETAHLPVFLITALDDRDSKLRGIDAGADDYISKPFDRIEILAKVKNSTNLIKYRKKSKPETESTPQTTEKFNENLFNGLAHFLLSNRTEDETIDIFRSQPVTKSKHSFQMIEVETGKVFLMISNNLPGKDAVMINLLTASLLKENVIGNYKNPTYVIETALEFLREISANYNVADLRQANISILLSYFNNVSGELVSSGINQTLYYASPQPSLGSQITNYQPYYLLGDQDLKISEQKSVFMFSSNIHDLFDQQEVVSFLNSKFLADSNENFSEIVPAKFGNDHDIVVVKLSF